MILGIVYQGLVFDDGASYTTDAYQHHQFRYLARYFTRIELVARVQPSSVRRGRERLEIGAAGVVHPLPAYRSLFHGLLLLPLVLVRLTRILFHERRRWGAVLIYDLWPQNVAAWALSRLLGIPPILLLGGCHADGIRYAHRDAPMLRRILAGLYARWAEFIEKALVACTPTLSDYEPLRFDSAEAARTDGPPVQYYLGSMVRNEDVRERRDACSPCRGVPRLLAVGRVVPIKGFEYAAEAVAILRAEGVDVWMDIVGPTYDHGYSGYLQRLQATIDACHVGDSVHIRGPVPFTEMEAVYEQADLLVLSSLSEGTPKILAEALARGIPVVSADVGGIGRLLRAVGAGVVVPPRDPRALADGIKRALANWSELSLSALRAAPGLTAEAQMARVAQFIREVAAATPTRRESGGG